MTTAHFPAYNLPLTHQLLLSSLNQSVKELRAPQLLALCRAFNIVHLPPGPRTLADLHGTISHKSHIPQVHGQRLY